MSVILETKQLCKFYGAGENQVKAIYDSEISNITRSEKNWKDVLKVAGQLYRYEFDNIVMVTAQ